MSDLPSYSWQVEPAPPDDYRGRPVRGIDGATLPNSLLPVRQTETCSAEIATAKRKSWPRWLHPVQRRRTRRPRGRRRSGGGSESGVEDEETAVIAAQIVARIVAGKEPVRSGAAAMSLQETLERHAKIELWDAMDDRARALVEVARLIAAAKSGSLQHPDILRVIDARAIHISPLLRQRYKELLMDTAIEWATRDLKDFGKVRGKAAEAPWSGDKDLTLVELAGSVLSLLLRRRGTSSGRRSPSNHGATRTQSRCMTKIST